MAEHAEENISVCANEQRENENKIDVGVTDYKKQEDEEHVITEMKNGTDEDPVDINVEEGSMSIERVLELQELAKSLNDYSDVDNYVELELDSSSSTNSSTASNRNRRIRDPPNLYLTNDLLLNADFLNDLDLDPFDVELMLENHGGHLLNLINLASSSDPRPAPPPYPCSEITIADCGICFDEKSLRKRLCCQLPVCDECIESYLVMQINIGNVQLRCPSSECNIYIHRDEILARLPTETKEKYYRFLVDANNDPNVKTCPRCSYIHKLDTPITTKKRSKKKKKNKKPDTSTCVVCPDCQLQWCFPCQAPWHENSTCKEFRKGDKLLRSWAQEYRYGQNNAQKCPHCKVYIEKKGGCDHMVCNHCGTSFCYRCGERYMSLKFLGNHTSRLSPFGCRYNFLPERPAARKAIRGFYLGAKLLGIVGLGGFIVCVGALFVGTSFIILPAYGGYRYYKFRQRRKWIKRHRKLWPELQKRPQIITREISTNTAQRGEKLPSLAIMKEELINSSQESTSSDDSNSVSEEDVVAIGIQGEGSQKVEVLVHAQDQQGHSEEGQSKNLGKTEVKGQLENTDEIQGKIPAKPESKDQIQVTSESGGKVHVTTIEVKKEDMKNDYSPVVMHIKTTNKTESKSSVSQSEMPKGSVSSRETTPDLDKEEPSKSTNMDSNENDTTTQETEKKEKHKNESEDSGFVIEEGNSETKGCFVRIFGKKLPVVWEKEKEGEKIIEKEAKHQKDNGTSTLEKVSVDGSLKRKKSSKSIKNQPDIVNCALMAEHKQKILSLGKELTTEDDVLSHGTSHGESCDKEEQNDPYYGLISADTCETPL